MSWQVASFAIVGCALGVAFWWYERSRPPAKLVAVVATLAALAALGRDAFAAIPDVKPITTIVLVGGLAFGAGPGFAIGAISGLASNILLGEGPWTPWQMLGWGLVGLLGAGLGRVGGRRLPPLGLALACALGAVVLNLVVDVYTWTGTGDHSLAAFGVVLGSALAFDLTHVVASFAFGLAFGAALLRMLLRVRSRLQVSWHGAVPIPAQRASRPLLVPVSVAALALAVPALALGLTLRSGPAGPAPVAAQARLQISREVDYLARAQNADGGFGGARGQASSELYSAWAAIGLAAAGRNPLSLRRGGHTVLDALREQASQLQGAGDLERTILALRACGAPVSRLGAQDPLASLLGHRSRDGSFGGLVNLTAFGILALRAGGYGPSSPAVRAAAAWMMRQQDADGGFGFAARGGGSDIDDTAAALQAMAAAGAHGGAVRERALRFLLKAQNLDGGYPQEAGGLSNAQSTSWAIQGLIAAGRNADAVRHRGSRTPLGYLESLIGPDGSVRYSRTGAQTPVWVTAQALTALARRPFPIGPARG